jgi:hypothetical protein
MSGMAGASAQSELHALFVHSGRMNHVLPPPGAPGNAVANHFEAENRGYQRWLERARPALDQVLRDAVETQGLPILKWPGDAAPRSKRSKSRQELVIDGSTGRPDRRFRLSVLVSQKLTDAQQDWLRRSVAAALEKHAAP